MNELDLLMMLLPFALVPVAFFGAVGCGCCDQLCVNCRSGTDAHATIQVDIAGLTNVGCSSCADFTGTYILTRTVLNPCQWTAALPGTVCNLNQIVAELPSFGGIGVFLRVLFNNSGGGFYSFEWQCTLSSVPGTDNCNWSAFSVPPSSAGGGGGVCDKSASTCLITAL
jgi:hypothetical protein